MEGPARRLLPLAPAQAQPRSQKAAVVWGGIAETRTGAYRVGQHEPWPSKPIKNGLYPHAQRSGGRKAHTHAPSPSGCVFPQTAGSHSGDSTFRTTEKWQSQKGRQRRPGQGHARAEGVLGDGADSRPATTVTVHGAGGIARPELPATGQAVPGAKQPNAPAGLRCTRPPTAHLCRCHYSEHSGLGPKMGF